MYTLQLNLQLRRSLSVPDQTKSLKSPIFDVIIGDETSDVERLVAYALYKAHKREWCVQFEDEHGRAPTDDEKIAFAKGLSVGSQIERYLKDAQDALGEYAGYLIDSERPSIVREAVTERIESAAKKIEDSSKLWNLAKQTAASTVITSFVLLVLVFAIEFFGVDIVDGIQVFRKDSAESQSATR